MRDGFPEPTCPPKLSKRAKEDSARADLGSDLVRAERGAWDQRHSVIVP